MGDVSAVPLHLAVHVSGFAVAGGLVAFAWAQRGRQNLSAMALAVAGLLLAVSHVAEGAMLAVGLAWPLYLRAAAFATLAFGLTSRSSGMAVAAAAVPAGGNVIAAIAGGLAATAALGGIVGRGRRVFLLAAGLLLWAVADLVTVSRPLASDWLSVVGSAAVMSWLVAQARRSLMTRFVSLFGGVLLAVVVALASASGFLFDRDLRDDRIDLLTQQVTAAAIQLQDDLPNTLAGDLDILEDSTTLPAALLQSEVDDATAAEVARVVGTPDVLLLTDATGRAVGSFEARSGEPLGAAETVLGGSLPVEQAIDGRARVAGLVRLELLDTEAASAELLAVAVEPLFPTIDGVRRRDVLAGFAVAAQRVDRRDRLDAIAAATGADVALLSGGDLANATVGADPEVDADLVQLAGIDGGTTTVLGGDDYFASVVPLTDIEGRRIGDVVLFEDASLVADLERDVTRLLFLVAVIGGVLATLLAAAATARATTGVRRLTDAAERIAAGDLSTRVDTQADDEVGRLGWAFDEMAQAVQSRDDELRAAARREGGLRERLESVTASMGESLLAVDGNGDVIMANPAAVALLGLDEDEVHGRSLTSILRGQTDDGLALVDALGAPHDRDLRSARGVLRRSGERGGVVAIAATSAPLAGEADGAGRVIVLRDVTGEVQIERMKTEFVSNAAHELRTPLTPVIGYSDLLSRHPDMDDDRRAMVVHEINLAALRVKGIVDKLVNFADLEAGRVTLHPEARDVGLLVQRVLDRHRQLQPDRTLRRRVARGLPKVVLDERWTSLILDELIDNALKFSDDAITITADRADDGRVRLGVKDKGVGIPADAIDEITEEFRQADGSATRRFGGLGLGLAIIERIAAAQGGQVDIQSRMGQGTHVTVALPVAQLDT